MTDHIRWDAAIITGLTALASGGTLVLIKATDDPPPTKRRILQEVVMMLSAAIVGAFFMGLGGAEITRLTNLAIKQWAGLDAHLDVTVVSFLVGVLMGCYLWRCVQLVDGFLKRRIETVDAGEA